MEIKTVRTDDRAIAAAEVEKALERSVKTSGVHAYVWGSDSKIRKVTAAFGTAALLFAFAAGPARAERRVGVRDAIDSAIATNVTTKLASAESEAARAQALEAASSLLPGVLGTASQSRIFRQNLAAIGLTGGPIPSLIGPYNSFDARLRLTQTLFDFSTIKRYQAAGAGKELAARQEDAAREQVAAAASLAYVEALRARKAVAAAQADDELAKRLLAQAQDQEKAGTVNGVDVVRAQTRESAAGVELLQAQVAERDAAIRLSRVAGWPLGDELAFAEDLSTAALSSEPLEHALAAAQSLRPEIAAAREQARRDALLVTAAQSERAPSLVGLADVGLSGNQPDSGARATGSIGAALSVPLFTGGEIRGKVAAAKAQKSRSDALLADAVAQVEEDVRLAYEHLSEAQRQVAAAEQTRNLAEQELKMAEDRYEAGAGDNVAVVTAQAELAQARSAFVSSLAGEHDARINLASALGEAREFKL
ncbi:MAG TPA: TolC family protein [Elusimicrobiota bacterium]|nr:TolC family protein [Elusimicrobiota bacterium]